ncbi:O-fucosyltransferase family protein [Methylomusa anaerophila]|nr:O-fucosyltransferase family protein [Methylomusa anaerophila]
MQRNSGFLLIKCWGCGFWSDMEHVVGHLLIAELLDRYPVVYWGPESRYGGTEGINAFEHFFLPVSAYSITDLTRAGLTYFPAMWNTKPLVEENPDRYIPDQYWPIDLMGIRRPETVIVSDRHIWPTEIMRFVPPGHPAYGLNHHDMYRYIFSKYIKLQPIVQLEAEYFLKTEMQTRPIVAVHVRGGDKIFENGNLWRINALYAKEIQNYLIAHPSASIFLLTDSEDILAEYKSLYGPKIIYTDCNRTVSGGLGVHVIPSNGYRKGVEILKDTLLALQCDAFIGNAHSNVSIVIRRLKAWQDGTIRLLGEQDLTE